MQYEDIKGRKVIFSHCRAELHNNLKSLHGFEHILTGDRMEASADETAGERVQSAFTRTLEFAALAVYSFDAESLGLSKIFPSLLYRFTSCLMARSNSTPSEPPGIRAPGTSL